MTLSSKEAEKKQSDDDEQSDFEITLKKFAVYLFMLEKKEKKEQSTRS